jgi:mono/diheme cytochrome c family protein
MVKGFILGIVVAIVVVIAGAYLFVTTGALPAGQDVKPGALEKWAAKTSLRATIGRETRGLKSPIPPTDDNLAAGVALYVAHCQVCHGGPEGVPSPIAKGLSPDAPQLAKHGVEDDPEETTYWKIAHGIRFTGMPAFRQTLSDREIWQMALFAKRIDKLSPGLRQAWSAGKPTP